VRRLRPYAAHLKYVAEAIGLREGVNDFAACIS
jgi:hypothetical protein